jgi:hypothetical protein
LETVQKEFWEIDFQHCEDRALLSFFSWLSIICFWPFSNRGTCNHTQKP